MKTIIAGVDFTDITTAVINKARELCALVDGQLWLIHVAEPDPIFVSHSVDSIEMRDQLATHFHDEHQQIQTLAEQLRQQGINANALLVQGATTETLIQQAEKLQADLLVIGKNRHGLVHRLLIGSNSSDIVKHSPLPTLLVPGIKDSATPE